MHCRMYDRLKSIYANNSDHHHLLLAQVFTCSRQEETLKAALTEWEQRELNVQVCNNPLLCVPCLVCTAIRSHVLGCIVAGTPQRSMMPDPTVSMADSATGDGGGHKQR